jgi:hypothetical protein
MRQSVWALGMFFIQVLANAGLQMDNVIKPALDPIGVFPDERQALVAVYQATDGAHWKRRDGWLGPAGTECDWYGVVCDGGASGEPHHVVSLYLPENNLHGQIPTEFSNLIHLEDLTLYGNHLTGELPDKIINAWLNGSLWIVAEARLFTDISEVDFEASPSALLCGQQRVILRADAIAVRYTRECRNSTPADRTTYCRVEKGEIQPEEFARLAWLIERNGFFHLSGEYRRNVTDAEILSTRVTKGGRAYEVVGYGGGGPWNLWEIELLIQGAASSVEWKESTPTNGCPRWDEPSAKSSH